MRAAQVRPDGTTIRWVELPGVDPTRVYLHGLGASSAPYYATAVAHPALTGVRSLLVDLLGFGISDRPTDATYTLEEHADLLAEALARAGVATADVVAHSMGADVAVLLATRHPQLVSRLVLVDPYLEEHRPDPTALAWRIADLREPDFVARGWATVLDLAGAHWASTMRLAGREALYRTAVDLVRSGRPPLRRPLLELRVPRTVLYPAQNGAFPGEHDLAADGVNVVPVPACGHNIMIDNVDGFARAVAAAVR